MQHDTSEQRSVTVGNSTISVCIALDHNNYVSNSFRNNVIISIAILRSRYRYILAILQITHSASCIISHGNGLAAHGISIFQRGALRGDCHALAISDRGNHAVILVRGHGLRAAVTSLELRYFQAVISGIINGVGQADQLHRVFQQTRAVFRAIAAIGNKAIRLRVEAIAAVLHACHTGLERCVKHRVVRIAVGLKGQVRGLHVEAQCADALRPGSVQGEGVGDLVSVDRLGRFQGHGLLFRACHDDQRQHHGNSE